ncbi:MAG: hypothetical protein KatS3mg058_4599 [Roseiflexus sp.]|nr:MAG: hypothetical protein KatS3mg058_4599 [Roseiflexus sp.]
MNRSALRQQAKLEFFAHIVRLERLRVAPGAQLVVQRHGGAPCLERLRDRAPRQQCGIEARRKGSGGKVEHRIGGIDDHDVRHAGIDQRVCQPCGVAGAQERQPARSAPAERAAQFVGAHRAEGANLIFQRQDARTV